MGKISEQSGPFGTLDFHSVKFPDQRVKSRHKKGTFMLCEAVPEAQNL